MLGTIAVLLKEWALFCPGSVRAGNCEDIAKKCKHTAAVKFQRMIQRTDEAGPQDIVFRQTCRFPPLQTKRCSPRPSICLSNGGIGMSGRAYYPGVRGACAGRPTRSIS